MRSCHASVVLRAKDARSNPPDCVRQATGWDGAHEMEHMMYPSGILGELLPLSLRTESGVYGDTTQRRRWVFPALPPLQF